MTRRAGAAACAPTPRCGPLLVPARCYFWPYSEDFVPRGARTSSFQSSASPGVRQRILREYALSPLYGARSPCCTLGTMRPARETVASKPEIARLLGEIMRLGAGDVSLGPLLQTTEMMLFRPGTPLSPRLGDDRRGGPHAYGRRPVVARTLMDVFLPEEFLPEDAAALGQLVREKLHLASREKKNAECGDDNNGGGGATVGGMDAARVLVGDMGIVHCEIPLLDEGGFVFDAVGGDTIDGEEAERIVQRWQERGE